MANQDRVRWFPDNINISNPTYALGIEQDAVLEETDEEVLADEGRHCHE